MAGNSGIGQATAVRLAPIGKHTGTIHGASFSPENAGRPDEILAEGALSATQIEN